MLQILRFDVTSTVIRQVHISGLNLYSFSSSAAITAQLNKQSRDLEQINEDSVYKKKNSFFNFNFNVATCVSK